MHKFIGITAALALLASSSTFRTAEAVPITGGTGPGGVGTTDGASTLELWLKADTLGLSDGASVTSWSDSSGNGNTATAGTAPTFSTGVLNGNPTVVFDDSDQLFFSAIALTNMSVFGVVQSDDDRYLFQHTGNRQIRIRQNGNPNISAYNGTDNPSSSAISTATEDFFIGEWLSQGSSDSISFFESGAARGSGTFTGGNPTGLNNIGRLASASLTLQVAEGIIFSERINAAQRIVLENALAAKYDLTLLAGDRYAGDDNANGDYDRDVFGIGQIDTSNLVDNVGSQGFGIEATAGLGNGEFVLAGHNVETNSLVDFEGAGLAEGQRWDRVWYVDTNASSVDVNLGFNFSDAGIGGEFDAADNFSLLYSANDDFSSWTFLSTDANVVGDTVFFDVSSADLADGFYTLGVNAALVPEPSAIMLLGTALIAVRPSLRRKRRNRRASNPPQRN